MPKFLLHYTSGVKEEIVEAVDGIEAYIKQRFGHINEYLKLGGATPKLIHEPAPEIVNEGSSSGSIESTEANATGTLDVVHDASQG